MNTARCLNARSGMLFEVGLNERGTRLRRLSRLRPALLLHANQQIENKTIRLLLLTHMLIHSENLGFFSTFRVGSIR